MRTCIQVGAWVLVLACVPLLAGQPAGTPPPKPDPKLQEHLPPLLERWAAETQNLTQMHVKFACKSENQGAFKKVYTFDGTAKFQLQKNGSFLALLELVGTKDNPDLYERYLYTGTHVYVWNVADKEVQAYAIDPKQQGKLPDEGPLAILFNMNPKTAKQRFDMTITKVDDWYTYLEVKPLDQKILASFTWSSITIYNKDVKGADGKVAIPKDLPARIVYLEPNKTLVTWTMQRIERDRDAAIAAADFQPPTERDLKARGWKLTVHTTPRPGEENRPPPNK